MKKSDFIFILFISFIVGYSVAFHVRKQGQFEAQTHSMIELEQKNRKQVQEIQDSMNSIKNIISEMEKK